MLSNLLEKEKRENLKGAIIMKKFITSVLSLLIILSSMPTASFAEEAVGTKKPKVSVIIPVYKAEPWLRECMDSVINQTLKEIEIICVDDGSPDNCGKILDEYASKDNRITVIHQENKGSSTARNVGIKKAQGEYIKFVDSDDIIDLSACEICYQKAKEVDADILVHGMYRFDNENKWVHSQPNDQIIKTKTFHLILVALGNHFYKNDLLKKENIKFNPLGQIAEDQSFNMICYPKAKVIRSIPDVIYFYRKNPTSLCNSTPIMKLHKSHCNNIKYAYDDWQKNNYFSSKEAKISFLKWSLFLMTNPKNYEFAKLFKDMISTMDKSLFTNDILNSLTKKEISKLQLIEDTLDKHRKNNK